jgi:hypothetical protein
MKVLLAAELVPNPAVKAVHENRAARIQRSFLAIFDALQRHSNKGKPQRIVIERLAVVDARGRGEGES